MLIKDLDPTITDSRNYQLEAHVIMGALIVRQAAVTLEHVLIKDLDPTITDTRNYQLEAHLIMGALIVRQAVVTLEHILIKYLDMILFYVS